MTPSDWQLRGKKPNLIHFSSHLASGLRSFPFCVLTGPESPTPGPGATDVDPGLPKIVVDGQGNRSRRTAAETHFTRIQGRLNSDIT